MHFFNLYFIILNSFYDKVEAQDVNNKNKKGKYYQMQTTKNNKKKKYFSKMEKNKKERDKSKIWK